MLDYPKYHRHQVSSNSTISEQPPAMARTETRMSVAEEAWGLVFQLALGDRSRLVEALDGLGLTFSQAHLLRMLAPEAPMPMHELAARLVCDASNVTGLADRLEARGL